MGLKLEVGKFYKTRDGRKVGPMKKEDWVKDSFHWMGSGSDWYSDKGLRQSRDEIGYGSDIIAEWTESPTGPVRTVTRKEIVPGVYGSVFLKSQTGQAVWIEIKELMNAAELRAAIATLTEIADALEDK